jgi:ADP-heptose:LPS heptosyltransferase
MQSISTEYVFFAQNFTRIYMYKKILVIRFSSIGDIVLTTPVVRCMKKQLGAEVHFLTKKGFEKILLNNPYINRVFSIEKKVSEIIEALKLEKYDCVIDLHNNIRSWQVKNALGVKSFSFDKLNFEKWLMVNLKINRLPNKHIVDRNLATVKDLGVVNDGQGLDYFIPKEDEVDVLKFLRANFTRELPPQYFAFRQAGFEPKIENVVPYIAFIIGAAHATKRLPFDKIIEICNGLNLPVFLLGGKEDAALGDVIAMESRHYVFNFCGILNLNQSASVVKQAHKVITHDTGLMHIAAAFNKNIIAVWGNTIPEFGMTAYTVDAGNPDCFGKGGENFEVKGLNCRPCSKIGYQKCPKGHFNCMRKQDSEAIILSANK